MGRAIVMNPGKKSARTDPMADVTKGDLVVTGEEGGPVVVPRSKEEKQEFCFMRSRVSPERNKEIVLQEIASLMGKIKRRKENILIAGGPAIVHAGAGLYVERLNRRGYIHNSSRPGAAPGVSRLPCDPLLFSAGYE